MVLKLDRRGIAMRLIFGDLAPHCAAQPWLAVLHEHAVEESGDIGGTQQLAVGCEMRPLEDDVVTLPLAGFARRVHQRRLPRIDRAAGAVGIGRVPLAVEDLEDRKSTRLQYSP